MASTTNSAAAAPPVPVVPGGALDLDASAMALVDGKPTAVPLRPIFAGRRVVLFSIPGALTPTCVDSQAPEYVVLAEELRAKGADEVACLAVNDPFVLDAMRKKVDAYGTITFLADGDGAIAKSLGITFDTGSFGGIRARRGSYIVEDGVFTHVNLEQGGAFTGPGSANTILAQL
jgi:glutaredoxin/glutathione-dependent peroxiredoxin